MNVRDECSRTYALQLWLAPGGDPEAWLDDGGHDEWGRPTAGALLRAWKPGFRGVVPRCGEFVSSRSLGEAVASHLEGPYVVSSVLHGPSQPDEATEPGRPDLFVEIRGSIDRVTPELFATLHTARWRVIAARSSSD